MSRSVAPCIREGFISIEAGHPGVCRVGENGGVADNRNASLGDMVRSILVLGALLLGLAALGYWFQVKPDDKVQAVDYATAVKAARGEALFAVLAPASLPKGWKATTVRYESGPRGHWHLGVMTDKGEYIGLEQSGIGTQRAIESFAPDTNAKGNTTVAEQSWQLRQSKRGETTLVREDGDITIIVTGTASLDVIEDYAGTLRSD